MEFTQEQLRKRAWVVAEVGNNHEGSYALAEEMIGLAKDAGADAVKFQTFLPEHYVSRKDAARFERLRKFQLSCEEFERLASHAKRAGITFFSTPFDLQSAEFLNGIQDIFKISSGDNTFYPLLEKVASFAKPIILSTGMANTHEIRAARSAIEKQWSGKSKGQFLTLLHCVSAYPVPEEEISLGAIKLLEKEFDCVVGYSDHSMGIDAAAASVLVGARVIEKHFTKDKNFSDFRDHQLSADPADLHRLVERVRAYERLLGNPHEKHIQKSESGNIALVRRSIATARSMSAGEVLALKDITWIRPGTAIPPGEEKKVLGKRLKRALDPGELILSEYLE